MDEEDSISGGDPEDAFEEAYLGWSESQLTQEQAANDKDDKNNKNLLFGGGSKIVFILTFLGKG